uniref:Uncharacterized protein n=1 Tax=Octopus bimaculoides TaxID=37653 RepID=A0A0L8GB05_OCTBM
MVSFMCHPHKPVQGHWQRSRSKILREPVRRYWQRPRSKWCISCATRTRTSPGALALAYIYI